MILIEHQIKTIIENWDAICDLANINMIDKKLFANRQFLNPYIFEDLQMDEAYLLDLVKTFKR